MKKTSLYLFFIFTYISLLAQEPAPDLTLMIPMSDGTSLPTDLYLPNPNARGLPCILLRSPSGRRGDWTEIINLAKEGYAIAIQETRSSIDPEGKTFPFISDGWSKQQDGFETVEWLAHCPYTNGKIGTWGRSAAGITQLLMAPSHPPHLVCQYILIAAASIYHHALFPGGQLLKHQAESWLGLCARDSGILSYVSQRPFYNDFWKQFNSLEQTDKVNVPAVHVAGWYDTFLQGTLATFKEWQEKGGSEARGRQKLLVGPWTHFWPLSQHFGDFEMPQAGKLPPVDLSPKRWFDHQLKGIPNGFDSLPNVTYFVMGPFDGSPSRGNVWKTSTVWPVPATHTPFYLTSTFELQQTPTNKESVVSYRYDPKKPIPTLGGRNLFLESGPKDQMSIEGRSDIRNFTSDSLTDDLEVTGPISAVIYFSSDQPDTDIVLRLCDVYPDGKSVLISEGGCRLAVCCQNSEKKEYQINEIKELKIDLCATSMVFAKGHAIRLSISSSSYPRYEKNPNIGFLETNTGKYRIAENKVYLSEKTPTRLILPIVLEKKT